MHAKTTAFLTAIGDGTAPMKENETTRGFYWDGEIIHTMLEKPRVVVLLQYWKEMSWSEGP